MYIYIYLYIYICVCVCVYFKINTPTYLYAYVPFILLRTCILFREFDEGKNWRKSLSRKKNWITLEIFLTKRNPIIRQFMVIPLIIHGLSPLYFQWLYISPLSCWLALQSFPSNNSLLGCSHRFLLSLTIVKTPQGEI